MTCKAEIPYSLYEAVQQGEYVSYQDFYKINHHEVCGCQENIGVDIGCHCVFEELPEDRLVEIENKINAMNAKYEEEKEPIADELSDMMEKASEVEDNKIRNQISNTIGKFKWGSGGGNS